MANDDPFADIGSGKRTAADDPFADIGAPSLGAKAIDVAKQIPAGLVAGTEAVASFPAQIAGLLGPLANRIGRSVPTFGGTFSDPEAERQQAELRALTAAQRGGGIAQYLPTPQTPAGEYARTASEFVPAAVLGGRGSLLRTGGVGATAGLTSEGAGQFVKGTEAEPYARVIGGVVAGHVAGRVAEGRALGRGGAPGDAGTGEIGQLTQAVEQAANRGYDAFRNAGFAFDPAIGAHYAVPLRTTMRAEGFTPRTARVTHEVINDIEHTPFTDPIQLQERYRELGKIARGADPTERAAAGIAQERLLQIAENPPAYLISAGDPAAGVATLREANRNWAALQRAERANQAINTAELKAGSTYSGLNLENQLRQRVGVLSQPAVRGGFSPYEQQQIRQFGMEAYPGANVVRYTRGVLGGGGGAAALGAGGLGALGAGHYLDMDPLAAGGATALTGLLAAKYGNMRALNAARELELMMLRRAPAAQGFVPTRIPGGRAAFIPATAGGPLQLTVRPSDRTLADLGD